MIKQKYSITRGNLSDFSRRLIEASKSDEHIGYIGPFEEYNIFIFYESGIVASKNGIGLIELHAESDAKLRETKSRLEKLTGVSITL